MKISRILSSKNWVAINLPLSKRLGLNAAFLFSHLCGLFEYYETRGELVEKDGEFYFYATIDTICENTPLSRPEQDTAIKILEQAGLLIKKTLGMPAKRYFSIPKSAEVILYDLLQFDGNRQTRMTETDKQECLKPTNKNDEKKQPSLTETDNNIDKELYLSNNTTFSKEKDSSEKTEVFSTAPKKNKIAVGSNLDSGLFAKSENQTEKEKNCAKKEKAETPEKPTRAKFVKPTIEEIEAYCRENNFAVDANSFIDHYIANGWKVGNNNPMKDWKATVRNWTRKNFSNQNNNLTTNQNNNQNATNQSTTKPNAQPNADTMRKILERDKDIYSGNY